MDVFVLVSYIQETLETLHVMQLFSTLTIEFEINKVLKTCVKNDGNFCFVYILLPPSIYLKIYIKTKKLVLNVWIEICPNSILCFNNVMVSERFCTENWWFPIWLVWKKIGLRPILEKKPSPLFQIWRKQWGLFSEIPLMEGGA